MGRYTVEEAARILDRSPQTVRVLARRLGLGRKFADVWEFNDEDLAAMRAVHPLGGRPRKDGKPREYKKKVSEVRKGRPPYKKKEGSDH